jgi:hypothetical protein
LINNKQKHNEHLLKTQQKLLKCLQKPGAGHENIATE